MCVNHRKPQLMIGKGPKLKIKDIVVVYLTKHFIPTPIKSPTIRG